MWGDGVGDIFQEKNASYLVANRVIFTVILPFNAILAEPLTASLNK
jgi:hypothetical protein